MHKVVILGELLACSKICKFYIHVFPAKKYVRRFQIWVNNLLAMNMIQS